MKKVSDIIAIFLKKNEIKHVFGIIGSANSHIFDSIKNLGYTEIINVHHEQVAVMAMGAYYRASGNLSASLITAGGGAANSITGIVSNWADSIPGIIITGNEPLRYIKEHKNKRMFGTQGFNIVKMTSDITKYSKCLTDSNKIQYELEKCLSITVESRPGPVLLDIPLDVQASKVNLRKWNFEKKSSEYNFSSNIASKLINEINKADRPLIIGGNGIKLSNSEDLFRTFVNQTNLPTTLSWSGIDILDHDNPNFFGRFGIYGQRAANFIVQSSDLLIVIGSRLALPQTGYNFDEFVRKGRIIIIDIDDPQFPKKNIYKHFKIDCNEILQDLNSNTNKLKVVNKNWIDYCKKTFNKYPWIEKNHKSIKGYINSYEFMDKLSEFLNKDDIIVTDMGTALLSGHQALKLKSSQRMFTSQGLGEMGYGLAGSIGAAVSSPNKNVLCLNCDGGIMMNLQELHTIVSNNLNIKIIIFSNDGYLMIKHTQKLFFKGRFTSVNNKTGIGLPNFEKLLPGFGYKYFRLNNLKRMNKVMKIFLGEPNHAVLEVFMDPVQDFIPKVRGVINDDNSIIAPPIEDMSPLLKMETMENDFLIETSEISKKIKR